MIIADSVSVAELKGSVRNFLIKFYPLFSQSVTFKYKAESDIIIKKELPTDLTRQSLLIFIFGIGMQFFA